MLKKTFTKENIEDYLKELSKEFKKQNGVKTPAVLILVGGAAILLKYNFRKSTDDVDAVILASSVMKDTINITGEKFKLPNNWLNMDFKNTKSYSDKLMSGRIYKNDLSDIAGILYEHKENKNDITIDKIKNAALYLYGSWDNIPEKSRVMINDIFIDGNYKKIYYENKTSEYEMGKILKEFEEKYPKLVKGKDINEVLEQIKIKKLSPAPTAASENANVVEDTAFLKEQMQIIKTACAAFDDTSAYAALDRLKEKSWKPQTVAALEKIRDTLFLHSDFDEAAELAEGIMVLLSC